MDDLRYAINEALNPPLDGKILVQLAVDQQRKLDLLDQILAELGLEC